MTDYLSEANRLIEYLSNDSYISAIALTSDPYEYLILTNELDRYVAADVWASGFDPRLEQPENEDSVVGRKAILAETEVRFLFASTDWATTACTDRPRAHA